MSIKRLMYHSVLWERFKEQVPTGTVKYYPAVEIAANVQGYVDRVISSSGEEVACNFKIFLEPTLLDFVPTFKDRVTLPDGRTFNVHRVNAPDPRGKVHHYQAYL